jgi:hypothetical protein
MALIFIKIFIIICLSISLIGDFSAYAICKNTDNCGSDSAVDNGEVFPDITLGDFNTAHGYHAVGMDITEGDANTVIGYESGKLIQTGNYNVAIGSESLPDLTNGDSNTAIGYRAGYANQSGSGNIFIGNLAGSAAGVTVDNKLYIDNSATNSPLIYGDFSSNFVTINEDLNVTDDLVVNDKISSSTINSGDITSTGSISVGNSGNFIIGTTSIDVNEFDTIDGVTPGTVSSGKAVIVDNSKNVSGFNTLTANTIQTNTFVDSDGDRILYKDTSTDLIYIGKNSFIFDNTRSENDVFYSSKGHLQIGNNSSDTTTIIGDLIIQEPTEANHAATRRYADKVSLMATTLDTRLPLYGNKHSLNLSSASTNNEIAFGLNFVGIYDGLHLPLDFSFGSAVSGDYNMGKFSLGMSW